MAQERKWISWVRRLMFGQQNEAGDVQEFDENLQFNEEVYET